MWKKVDGSAKSINGVRIAMLGCECCPVKCMLEYVPRWAVEQLGGFAKGIEGYL
jgi:hypothetical protein